MALAGCRDHDGERAAPAPRAPAAAPPGEGAPPVPAAKDTGLSLPPPPPLPATLRGLPPVASPEHNPTTPAKVELGRLLFHDPRLSASGKTSCASCHQQARGWADGVARARTDDGHPNLRHTPSLYNIGYHREWAWDGGMPTLEALILSHWRGQLGGQPDDAAARLARAPGYAARFSRAFAGQVARERIAEALAAYTRTLRSGDAAIDRHEAGL
ncbi:MAG TPA: cytochrome-c peroxidase, partial [Kofleriaceae bacterium]|nr:cytochrome-c peroxidase [Kofleriaceae bacterium]